MDETDREVDRQLKMIGHRAAEIVPQAELAAKMTIALREKRPLRVKYGIDPTATSIHIGHLVPCRLLRLFQDLGHIAVLIIGDYTATVGDPTGRGSERRRLSPIEVENNMRLYSDQLFRVVDRRKAEVHYQSEWFASMTVEKVFELISNFSVAQMLTHETFRNRMESGSRLSLHELMYPVMQAYDSVQIEADVEIGGTDQRFNCLCGRDLQRAIGKQPQVVVTVPLLMGIDGRKMSKTMGNQISTNMSANEIVGRVMSIPDELMRGYVRLTTDWDEEEQTKAIEALAEDERHPREVKMAIAENIASQLCGTENAIAASAEFDRVFREKKKPQKAQRVKLAQQRLSVLEILTACRVAGSKSEGRRLIEQGGVRVDGRSIESGEELLDLSSDVALLLNVGKRRYFELLLDPGTT